MTATPLQKYLLIPHDYQTETDALEVHNYMKARRLWKNLIKKKVQLQFLGLRSTNTDPIVSLLHRVLQPDYQDAQ